MIVEERSRNLGNFMVGRLLPFRKKRQVGPFTFIDHMGPSILMNPNYLDVDQHPHIGLSTLTYLLDGEIEHRDSTGAHKVIRAGDVGFMTAGRGVTHTERTPQSLRTRNETKLHGYQVWVALPKQLEEMEPRFDFVSADELPKIEINTLKLTLIAGDGFGLRSPLPVHSPLFMVDVEASENENLDIKGQLNGEIAVVVCKGKVMVQEEEIKEGQMLISKTENECKMRLAKNSRVLLFGGKAFPEERYMHWNFVSSSKERLDQAKEDWKNKMFPKVKGDDTYIDLPSY